MPFPSALTAPDYTKLRAGGHKSNQYLLLGQNVTVFAARVNQTTFTASFGQITFDTVTTGAYTDILEGMTVLISATDDKRAAYFVGRVRADNSGIVSTSTVLNVNETSATVASNDYIFVLRDYRLFHELGSYTDGVYKKDYARLFSALKPLIYGLQSTYAGVVSGSPEGFTVVFAASAVAATASATISSYVWTLPSGTTVTAGSTGSANVTVRFDASATEYWVRLVVTDSGGRTQTRYISVFAIPADLSTTISLGVGGANIPSDIDNGLTASVDAFAGFTSVLDNTLAVIVDVEYYGATQTSIVSAVKFVGRMRSDNNAAQTDEKIAISRKAQIEIEGVAAQMTRITTPQITLRDSSAAAVWDEITKLTIWRSVAYLLEHSTFHNLYSLSFDSTADTFYAYQLLAPTGNMLSAANDLLKSINAALEFAPTGEARAVRNLNFLTTAERSALVTVADFEAQDWIGFSIEHQHVDSIGIVEASGGTYFRDGGVLPNLVVPLLSIAPGVAQGNAEGVSPLPSQVLTANVSAAVAQAELNVRAGNQFAFANGNDELNMDFRTGYNWLVPSRYQYYTFTIEASETTFGRAYTTDDKWWCKSVSARHDNESGKKEVNAVFVLETSGADIGASGQTVDMPPPGTTAPILPYIPPTPAYPYYPPDPSIYLPSTPTIPYIPPYIAPGNVTNGIPVTGDAVFTGNSTEAGITRNFLGVPRWTDVTPELDIGYTIRDGALVGTRGYILVSNGVNSVLYTNPNVFGTTAEWTAGEELVGEYTRIVPMSTQGIVYIEGSLASGAGCADSWEINEGTETARTADSITADSDFEGGTNRIVINVTGARTGPAPTDNFLRLINLTVLSGTQDGSIGWFLAGASYPGDEQIGVFGGDKCVWWLDVTSSLPFSMQFDLSTDDDCGECNTLEIVTAYSDDYGVTFATPEPTGALTVQGIDATKIGTTVLVGGAGQVMKATSGSTWAAYGDPLPADFNPTAIYIPRYQFGSTSSGNTSSDPQYLVVSSTEDEDGETMYKVTSAGTVFTAITPTVSSDKGLAVDAHCVWMPWWSGSIIFAVLSFGGSPRLVVSTNAGGSWSDKGIIDDDAVAVIGRRGDKTMQQIFLTNGNPAYSNNRGTSIVSKSFPADTATDPIQWIFPYG